MKLGVKMRRKIESAPSPIGEKVVSSIISILNWCWEGYYSLNKLRKKKNYINKIERILEARKRISQKAKEILLEKEIRKLTFQNRLLEDRIKRLERTKKTEVIDLECRVRELTTIINDFKKGKDTYSSEDSEYKLFKITRKNRPPLVITNESIEEDQYSCQDKHVKIDGDN